MRCLEPHLNKSGFTLVELLTVMVISMVLLAGLFGNYLLELQVNHSQARITERLADLRQATQVMARELRQAKGTSIALTNTTVGAKTTKRIAYDDIDDQPGYFEFETENGDSTLRWDPPGTPGLGELIRDLGVNADLDIPAASGDGVYTFTLTMSYRNHSGEEVAFDMPFKVWPRNN